MGSCHPGQQRRPGRPAAGPQPGRRCPAPARSRSARSSRRCPRRWSARASPGAGGRSPASWSSCCPRPARCRCTPTRPGPGRGSTSGPRSARPRRGSCSTRRATAPSRLRRDRLPARAPTATGSRTRCAGTTTRPSGARCTGPRSTRARCTWRTPACRTTSGRGISFIEVQEPSDHIVIPETDGDDDAGATMGLGWDLALDMIDYTGAGRGADVRPGPPAAAGAAHQPRLPRGAAVRTTTCCRSSTPPRWRWRTRSRSATGGSRSRSWRPAPGPSRATSAPSRSPGARRSRCRPACRSASGPARNRSGSIRCLGPAVAATP